MYAQLFTDTKAAGICQEPTAASATVVTKATDRHARTSTNVKSTSAAHLLIVSTHLAHIVALVPRALWEMAWHVWISTSATDKTTVTAMQYVSICSEATNVCVDLGSWETEESALTLTNAPQGTSAQPTLSASTRPVPSSVTVAQDTTTVKTSVWM